MSDHRRYGQDRRPRDPMGRPYDPYRGHDDRGPNHRGPDQRGPDQRSPDQRGQPGRGPDERSRRGNYIPDETGYDMGADRRGAADRGYRHDSYDSRDHATDQYRSRDGGHLGDWDWQQARRGEVEGDYGRGYGSRETGAYHRDDQYADRRGYPDGYVSREEAEGRRGEDRRGQDMDRGGGGGPQGPGRGLADRAADQVSAWFGDDEAARRRHRDELERDDDSRENRSRRDRNWTGW